MPDHHDALIFILVLLAALVVTLYALTWTLPAQNVISAAALIAFLSGLIEIIGAKTGVPFGPFFYTKNLGPLFLGLLPWPIPLIWVVVILNSRGAARLILRPWRELSRYGFWSIGLTCALTVFFDLALEPFAASANHFWIWKTPKNVPAWYGAPWISFAGLAAATLLLLAFATPWLINKKPVTNSPPDYFPLVIWSFLSLLLTVANFTNQFWLAAGFTFVITIIVSILAWRNSRW
jgi:uncharacterized membrane protein